MKNSSMTNFVTNLAELSCTDSSTVSRMILKVCFMKVNSQWYDSMICLQVKKKQQIEAAKLTLSFFSINYDINPKVPQWNKRTQEIICWDGFALQIYFYCSTKKEKKYFPFIFGYVLCYVLFHKLIFLSAFHLVCFWTAFNDLPIISYDLEFVN